MVSYYGDFALAGTVNIGFTTVDSTGAPAALSSATVGVFRGNATTRYTVGVTGTVSFNSQTGHNMWMVSLLDSTVYLPRHNYTVVMSAGSVGAVNVAGYQLGTFSIENRSVSANVTSIGSQTASASGTVTFPAATLASTTNITAGAMTSVGTLTTYTGNTVQTGDSFARIGAAGAGLTAIDLPNQTMDITGNITGNLSGSVGSVTGAVGSVTGAVGSVTSIGANGIGAASVSSEAVTKIQTGLATPTNITAGVITTVASVTSIGANGIGAASVSSEAVTKIQTGLATPTNITAGVITTVASVTSIGANGIGAASVSTEAVTKIQNGLATPTNITGGIITTVTNLTNAPTVGDFTAVMKTSVTAAATAATPIAASVSGNVDGNVTGSVGSVVGAVGSVTSIGSSGIGAASLSTEAVNKITDLGLGRDWTLVTTTIGARSNMNAFRRLRNRVAVSSSVGTVYKEDDSTSAWTMAVTTIAAQAISEVDPG